MGQDKVDMSGWFPPWPRGLPDFNPKLSYILPGKPIPKGSLFHERLYRITKILSKDFENRGRLLDLGCGNASQSKYFTEDVEQVVGLDLKLTNRNAENVDLMEGKAECLPVKSAAFEYIVCFEVLEHIKKQSWVLDEIHRILKPRGMIFLSVPNRWWIFETHGMELPLLRWNRVPFISWLPKRIHNKWARARNYTTKEIKYIVAGHGFSQVESQLITAPMDVIKMKWLQNLLRGMIFRNDTTIIPFLASTILVSARK